MGLVTEVTLGSFLAFPAVRHALCAMLSGTTDNLLAPLQQLLLRATRDSD